MPDQKPYLRTLIFLKTTAGSTAMEKIRGKVVTTIKAMLKQTSRALTFEPLDCCVFSVFWWILLIQYSARIDEDKVNSSEIKAVVCQLQRERHESKSGVPEEFTKVRSRTHMEFWQPAQIKFRMKRLRISCVLHDSVTLLLLYSVLPRVLSRVGIVEFFGDIS